MTLPVAALFVSLAALLVGAYAAWQARRSATAARDSAIEARQARRLAARPELTLTAGQSANYGPFVDLRLLSDDLDGVSVELVTEPNEVNAGVDTFMSLHQPNVDGRRLDLGPMRAGERQRVQVGAQGSVTGLEIHLRCDCRRGDDTWAFPVSATFPPRDPSALWDWQKSPRPGLPGA